MNFSFNVNLIYMSKAKAQWMIRMLRVSREGVEVEESRGRIEIYVNFSYFEYMAIFIDIDLY